MLYEGTNELSRIFCSVIRMHVRTWKSFAFVDFGMCVPVPLCLVLLQGSDDGASLAGATPFPAQGSDDPERGAGAAATDEAQGSVLGGVTAGNKHQHTQTNRIK